MRRNQSEAGEVRGRMCMRTEARLRRTATSYGIVDSLAKVWQPIGDEGVFTWATATLFLLDDIHGNSPHESVRELHRDIGISNQINGRINQVGASQTAALSKPRHISRNNI